jgi:hypothetical protein
MQTPDQTPNSQISESISASWRNSLSQSAHYWEPRRLIYNAVLAAVTLLWFVGTWPHFRPALNPGDLLRLAGLALLANVCYSAAYLVDLPLQRSALNAVWNRRRWGLWLTGTIFATVLTNYWIADEIYPFVR